MSTPTYGTPTPTDPPAQDVWTSPLWADPRTVGGVWPDATTEVPSPYVAPLPVAQRRSRSRGLLIGAALVAAGLLVGVGVVKVLPTSTTVRAVQASPSPTALAPTPTPGRPLVPVPQPSDGAGADQLPGDGLGQDPQPGPSGSPRASSASGADPAVVAAVSPGIVNIETTVGYDGDQAAGTGIVLTSDGVVLTNHHVVAGSTAIRVAVAGTTRSYDADVVGYDATHDIAVLALRGASGLSVAPIGDSATVRVGDAVVGLGNAGGAGGKPIAAGGTVTGLDKSITATEAATGVSERLTGLIETDADIAQGDSGGALASAEGKVIGVITAGSLSPASLRTNAGYAVPINQAMSIAADIRAGKASATVHIGASAFLGITVAMSGTGPTGVGVSSVVPGSAAAESGLTAGSTITRLDGTSVTTSAALRAVIARHKPGDTVSMTWVDGAGNRRTHDVTFGSGPVG